MKKKLIVAACIAICTFIVYLPALNNGFVHWDDDLYVSSNVHISSLDLDLVKWAFTDVSSANWHPVTWFSHAVDYAIWGANPRGHHLTNAVVHAANAVLAFLIFLRLLEAADRPDVRRGRTGGPGGLDKRVVSAALAALLFGIHPLHVESVAWVAERKDVLSSFFFLGSLLLYLMYATAGDPASKGRRCSRAFYAASVLLFLCALMSKAMAVTLPLVLLIIDWYPLRRFSLSTSMQLIVREKIPYLLFSAAASAAAVFAQQSQGSITWNLSLPTRLLVAANATMSYAGKMVFPSGLSPFYPYPQDTSLHDPRSVVSLLLLLMLIAGAVWQKRRPVYGAVLAYYLVTLLPVLGILQIGYHSMADRYTYLPSLGPFATWILVNWTRRSCLGRGPGIWIRTMRTSIILWAKYCTRRRPIAAPTRTLLQRCASLPTRRITSITSH